MHDINDERGFSPRLRAALKHAERFLIIPLKPGEKTPAIDNWPERATRDRATIIKLWSAKDYNIGIVAGPTPGIENADGTISESYSLVIVDYDSKPGQHGAAALRVHTLLGYSDTLTSKTPNGVHKFYCSTVPIPNSQSRIAENVDVRGVHGYVVAPGSTVNGVDYHWIGDETEPAPFPEEFKLLALKPSSPTTHDKRPIGELDRPSALESGKQYLINDAPEALQGHGGDAATYRVAARLKDLGISEEMALELMLQYWNMEKASPPWVFDALRTKVSNAYRYGKYAPGVSDPLNEFGATEEPKAAGAETSSTDEAKADEAKADEAKDEKEAPEQDASSAGLGRNAREPMLDESFAEAALKARSGQVKPLIEGILRLGELSAVYGTPGSGKTFSVLDMAFAIATGRPWNKMPTTQGAVLYVAAEGGPAVLTRILALQTRHKTEDVPIRLLRYPIDMRTGTFDAKRLIELVRLRQKELNTTFVLIVVDTLSVALAGGNDTEHMQAYLYNAKLIQTATKAHVLSIHHPGKDTAKGLRGHSTLRDMMDTVIEVYAPEGAKAGARRQLTVHKQRDGAVLEQTLKFKLETIKLGTDVEGQELSSCVVQWVGDDAEDMRIELTPSQQELYSAILRWAKAEDEDKNDVTPRALLDWIVTAEPEHPIAQAIAEAKIDKTLKSVRNNLTQKITRLREMGYLAHQNKGGE